MKCVVVCTGLIARESDGLTLTPKRLKMEMDTDFWVGVVLGSDDLLSSLVVFVIELCYDFDVSLL